MWNVKEITRVLTGLAAVALTCPALATGPIEWQGGQAPAYEPEAEFTANSCELYVNSFSIYSMSYRGARSTSLNFEIITRPGDTVLTVGGTAHVVENSYVRIDGEKEIFSGERSIGFLDARLLETIGYVGKASLQLTIDWDQFGTNGGTREIMLLNLFVDLRQDGQIKRFWLNESGAELTAADYDQSLWEYEPSFPLGYGTQAVLSPLSGSPVYQARSSCK
jgi:hypothetical protein